MISYEKLHKDQVKYIDKIQMVQLKAFVINSLAEFSTISKLKKANAVADIVWQKFITAGYINEHAQQQFVDITIAAALMYNIFYDKNDITTILKHRTKLTDVVKICDLDERVALMVYEVIESQLGENHPIQRMKSLPNSPSGTLSDAIWFVEVYKKSV